MCLRYFFLTPGQNHIKSLNTVYCIKLDIHPKYAHILEGNQGFKIHF